MPSSTLHNVTDTLSEPHIDDISGSSSGSVENLRCAIIRQGFNRAGVAGNEDVDSSVEIQPARRSVIIDPVDISSKPYEEKSKRSRKLALASRRIRLNQDSIPVSLLAETSIHGLKYIAQEDRHWVERLFWLSSFLLGVISSGYLIHGVWDRYNKTPVIVTFDANGQSTNLIPFPAVTICDDNLISRRKVEEFEKIVREVPYSNIRHRQALRQLRIVRTICNTSEKFADEFRHAFGGEQEKVEEFVDNTPHIFKFLRDTASCEERIRACNFGGRHYKTWELFEPIITSFGKCCTFNILPPQLLFKNLTKDADQHWADSELANWLAEIQNPPNMIRKSYTSRPQLQVGAGKPSGLTVLLAPDSDDYYCGESYSEGARFVLHSSFEMPQMAELSTVAPPGKEIRVEVSAEIIKADDDIRGFTPEKRKCVFPNERTLETFTYYTRQNCIEECTAVYLRKKCDCTPFPMSHYDMGHGGRMCSYYDVGCVQSRKASLQYHLERLCPHCDPLCEETTYSQQFTMANLKTTDRLLGNVLPEKRPKWANNTMTLMHVYLGTDRTLPKLRKALYGMEDLIANTGGILGLCLGFSVLSGIELVYFVTLRAIFSRGRQGGTTRVSVSVSSKLGGLCKTKSKVVELTSAVGNPPVGEGSLNGQWM